MKPNYSTSAYLVLSRFLAVLTPGSAGLFSSFQAKYSLISSLALSGSFLLAITQTHAADGTWNVDANGLWSVSGNWTPGIADGSGFTANFTNDITADRTVSLDTDRTLTSLVFGDSNTATAGSWILDNNGVSTNNLILAGTTPGITVNALGTNKTATISAIIEGTAGLVKSGTGTLILSAANTYTGGTTISAGILNAGTAGALSTGAVVNNATLNLTTAATTVYTFGAVSGNGTINVSLGSGPATANLGAATWTSFVGTINVGVSQTAGSGKVALTTNALPGTATVNVTANSTLYTGFTGTVTHNAALTLGGGDTGESFGQLRFGATGHAWAGTITLTGSVTGGGDFTVGVDGSSAATISGAIGQSGGAQSFSKGNTGTLTLSGSNTYTGTTVINGGVLSTDTIAANGTASGIGQGTAMTLNGGTFRYTGSNFGSDGGTKFNRDITVGSSGGTLDLTVANFVFYSGALSGSGALNILSAGSGRGWLFTGNNASFSGPISIGNGTANSGFLQYRSNAANPFGTGTITINGGGVLTADNGSSTPSTLANAIVLNGGNLATQAPTMTYSGAITINANSGVGAMFGGSGDIVLSGNITGSGTLNPFSTRKVTVSGSNGGFTGAWNMTAGTTTFNSTAALGDGSTTNTLIFNGGTLQAGGAISSVSTRGVTLTGSGTIDTNGNAVSIAGIIGGSGTFTKIGTGTLTLSGTNTYNGATTVNLGTLSAGAAAGGQAFGNGSAVTLANAVATLDLNGFSQTIGSLAGGGASGGNVTLGSNATLTAGGNNSSTTYAGIITGTGTSGLTKTGSGTLTLTGANTYTGTTTVSQGTLLLTQNFGAFDTSAFHGAVNVESGATLTMNNNPTGWGGGLTTLNVNGGTVNGNGGLGAFGVTYNLTGGTITGTARLDLGRRVTDCAINSLASGTTSVINNSQGIMLRGGTGQTSFTITTAAGTTPSGVDLQINGGIAEVAIVAPLVKAGAGTLLLNGVNTYTGTTTVNAGTLQIGNGGSTAAGSAVTVSNVGSALVVNGTVNGTLNAAAGTTVSGTGTVVGNATISGNLNPGSSPGELNFSNSLTLANATVTTMEINGPVLGTNYDNIDVGTILTYDGALTLAAGAVFGAGITIFDLFEFGSQTGSFDSVTLTGAYTGTLVNNAGVWTVTTNGANESWSFSQATGDLTLTVIPEPSTALLGLFSGLFLLRRRR